MIDGKPWYASQTIWGGIAAVIASLGGAVWAYQNHDINAAIASLAAAAGGVQAIVGRFKAVQPIASAQALPPAPKG